MSVPLASQPGCDRWKALVPKLRVALPECDRWTNFVAEPPLEQQTVCDRWKVPEAHRVHLRRIPVVVPMRDRLAAEEMPEERRQQAVEDLNSDRMAVRAFRILPVATKERHQVLEVHRKADPIHLEAEACLEADPIRPVTVAEPVVALQRLAAAQEHLEGSAMPSAPEE